MRQTALTGHVYHTNCLHFSMCACHPCAGAMLIFSVSLQFERMIPEGNPSSRVTNEIGTPRPRLEPQITSLEKCNIKLSILETPVY